MGWKILELIVGLLALAAVAVVVDIPPVLTSIIAMAVIGGALAGMRKDNKDGTT